MSFPSKLLPALVGAFLFIACDDDKGAGPGGTGKAALLTAKKWKKTADAIDPAVDFNGDGVLVTDIFAEEGGCSHDDVTQFQPGGKLSVDEGASKCDPDDPQTETGTWSLSDGETVLTMTSDLGGPALVLGVQELTAARLKVTMASNDWGDGKNHVETLTFQAQ